MEQLFSAAEARANLQISEEEGVKKLIEVIKQRSKWASFIYIEYKITSEYVLRRLQELGFRVVDSSKYSTKIEWG